MIDAENLALGKTAPSASLIVARERQVVADRLFDDDAGLRGHEIVLGELVAIGPKSSGLVAR